MSALEEQFLVFMINEEEENFDEIDLLDAPIYTALDTFFIFIIVDSKEKEIWIWQGEKASIRKKFIATQKAPEIRDEYGIDFKITAIDEGSEPPGFKKLIGL
ncbi:MAG: hypothetical protein KGD68_03920 [Candidatus Lokiarchaeota archaeon]|nr:hypothetical protein [Candidatus Lokiarchaeota archaeon]